MLCELEKAGARTTLQLIDGGLYVNGELVDSAGAGEFHRLYVRMRLEGWKELQVYF